MEMFYENIKNKNCEQLLKATPYSKEPMLNFDGKLDKETFFEYLYSEMNQDVKYLDENIDFNKKIHNALNAISNDFSKVGLINIQGYAGCGKTTYVHHLLWEMQRNSEYGEYDVVDFEGCNRVEEPFIRRISVLLSQHCKNVELAEYLRKASNCELFDVLKYSDYLSFIKKLSDQMLVWNKISDKSIYELYVKKWINDELKLCDDRGSAVYALLLVDFFILLFDRFHKTDNNPVIIVVDNSDSMSNQLEQNILLPVFTQFVNECNYFFDDNHTNELVFNNRKIYTVLKKTKLLFILTTRIATTNRYDSIVPDLERVFLFRRLSFPAHYYNHLDNIHKRVLQYTKWENDENSEVIRGLTIIDDLSIIAYQNEKFLQLFNGSVRTTIERMCSLLEYPQELIYDLLDLTKKGESIQEVNAGADGFFLWLIFCDLKANSVYESKLDLSPVNNKKVNNLSLSRLVLTVLHEKNGRCSMYDLLLLLTSVGFTSKDICDVVWKLCEACRDSWRRLVVFNRVFPKSMEEMEIQADLFDSGDKNEANYTDLTMCMAGNAYLEYVIPHFEFMLSRLGNNRTYLRDPVLQPLFSSGSERNISRTANKVQYGFDLKIDKVFSAVKRCCDSSFNFAEEVRKTFRIDRFNYINNTVFNYHTVDWDSTMGFKQSYESRLIFSHVGYIERYRRYIINKYKNAANERLVDINKKLVLWIRKYLKLYQDSQKCYQTEVQNKAADELWHLTRIIEESGYRDFYTRIELK